MRDKLLKVIEKIYIWALPKTVKAVKTEIIPVTRSIAFRSGMNKDQIKERLVKDMSEKLVEYTEYTEEVKDTGVTILTARLDVVQKINVEGVKIDE